MTGADSGRFDDLPPSAKYVYHTLESEGSLTRQELLEETDLPEPTLDRALESLHNEDYILKTRDSGDLRKVVINTRTIPTYNPPRD